VKQGSADLLCPGEGNIEEGGLPGGPRNLLVGKKPSFETGKKNKNFENPKKRKGEKKKQDRGMKVCKSHGNDGGCQKRWLGKRNGKKAKRINMIESRQHVNPVLARVP